MHTVAALIVRAANRRRIARALYGVATVHFCEYVRDLYDLLDRPEDIVAILTDLRDAAGISTVDAFRTLQLLGPVLPVTVCVSLSGDDVHQLTDWLRSGAAGIMIYDVDDGPLALSRILVMADLRSVSEAIWRETSALLPRLLHPFFAACAQAGAKQVTVQDLLGAIGTPHRTLVARLRRADLPTAECVVGWHRVLHAAWRVERSRQSVEQIAEELGFASSSGLYNAFRRYAGISPLSARAPGGFDAVLTRYKSVLTAGKPNIEVPRYGSPDHHSPV